MRLLFDIGNTRLKWALEDSASFIAKGAMTHKEFDSMARLSDLLPINDPTAIWVSNVGPAKTLGKLKSMAKSEFNLRAQVVTVTSSMGGITNAYAEHDQLGVDRWVAAIGARQVIRQGAVIVIDAGTAVTVDLLDNLSVYQGGAILPGASLMHDSLVQRTAGIESNLSSEPPIIGKTTSECVNSGVHYGLVGAIETVVKKIQKTLPRKGILLVTGGDSGLINRNSKYSMKHLENLVLVGLLAIANEADG